MCQRAKISHFCRQWASPYQKKDGRLMGNVPKCAHQTKMKMGVPKQKKDGEIPIVLKSISGAHPSPKGKCRKSNQDTRAGRVIASSKNQISNFGDNLKKCVKSAGRVNTSSHFWFCHSKT